MRTPRGATARPATVGGWQSFWPQPRTRRPMDVARLALAAVALAWLVVLAALDPDLLAGSNRLVPDAARGLPRALLAVADVATSLGALTVLIVLAVDAARWRRSALTSAAAACVLGVLGGLAVASLMALGTSPEVATVLTGPADSAGLPVTAAVALVVGADLQRRRWSGPARVVLVAAVACALVLGSLTVPSAAYALLVGTAAGLAVRVAIGVVPARPPDDVVRSVLERAGWELTALRERDHSTGRTTYLGLDAQGASLSVIVIDPDRRGVPFGRRAWALLRLRTAAVGHPALSLRGQLERQALVGALAEAAGVATPRVLALLAAGPALVMVERPLVGTPFPTAPHAATAAEQVWEAARALHDAGVAHGTLTADKVLLLPDGRAGFTQLVTAQPAATELQRELDVVALLVAMAGHLDADRAVAALRAAYGTTPVAEARLAALLQPLALPRSVRRTLSGSPLLADLRAALSGPGADDAVVEPPRLERLRLRTVFTVVGGTVAAYVLATQLSDVSLANILRDARPGWLAVALPLGRTALVQLASSFLTLVTPPAVGHVGLNIRYLQRAGVPIATAAATVTVSEAVTIAMTVVLLLACSWFSGISESRLTLLPSGNVLAVLAVAAIVLALAAAAPPTRRLLRRRVEPLVRSTLPQLVAMGSDPRRLGIALLGVLVMNGGYMLALDASLRAFSTSLAAPTLVVVYLVASTVGSAAPTPGGLGAVEAALVGGLTATGVPLASALPAVLAFRAATFWLPAPVGYGAFVVLQRRGWV